MHAQKIELYENEPQSVFANQISAFTSSFGTEVIAGGRGADARSDPSQLSLGDSLRKSRTIVLQ